MSSTLAVVRNRVQVRMRSRSAAHPLFDSDEIDASIASVITKIAMEPEFGLAWSTGFLTFAANDTEKTKTSVNYNSIALMKRQDDGEIIYLVTPARLEHAKQFASGHGDIQYLSAFEDSAQTTRFRCYPTPRVTNVIDALIGTMPARPEVDDASIPFSDAMVEGITLKVCSRLIKTSTREQRSKFHIGEGAAAEWQEEADGLIQGERDRLYGMQKQDEITMRWR
jgi:hypothetical protein